MHAFQQAVDLAPDFALAHAELARGHAVAYYLRHDLSPERLAAADASAARAVKLAPDNPRVLVNLAYYRLWGYRDVEGALAYFERAGHGRPDNADILEGKAYVYSLRGDWEEARDAFRRAFDLSLRSADLVSELARTLIMLRRYPEAIAATDEAISLAPDTLWPYLYKVIGLWSWRGDLAESRSVLEECTADAGDWLRWIWFKQTMSEGRYEEALGHLDPTPDGWIRIKILARPNALLEAYVLEKLGDEDRAASAYERARRLLETEVATSPGDPRLHSSLGIVYAVQGRREDAIREGLRGCELLPRSRDGFYYLPFVIDLAHIYTILGDNDAALERLEYLLDNPSWTSTPYLRMDPRWDSLHADPRFQALLARHEVEP
jgi:tetratricopeptide (TPR) repeat protein